MAFCVTFVFTVTLSVFPAVTADVKTVFKGWGTLAPMACAGGRVCAAADAALPSVLLRVLLHRRLLLPDLQPGRLVRPDCHHLRPLGECLVVVGGR